mmetsp:Transcript_2680/g.3657  ORF Transcript_2680/g.3657 Transcript_2680/m.3657 type:complete len:318 (+) Transcript_2680:44-997(+)
MKATDSICKAMTLMKVKKLSHVGITHPFGDARTVKQAFPAGIDTAEADPFLMCDYFDMKESKGKAKHEDELPVNWHPHRGFDIASYIKTGTGRHGDSLGNRITFKTPGMQWMSTGSGVEHGEGGANEKGVVVQGFQIWINVPAERKMDDPRYGTVPPEDLPVVDLGKNAHARLLAGDAFGKRGPFETVQTIQMIDFELEASANITFNINEGMDTAMLFVYEGTMAKSNDEEDIEAGGIILFDAESSERGIELVTSTERGASALLFVGKKLKEPIAWHGPIVMNTQQQISQTLQELRSGRFPPKRVDWDYKRISSKPN